MSTLYDSEEDVADIVNNVQEDWLIRQLRDGGA